MLFSPNAKSLINAISILMAALAIGELAFHMIMPDVIDKFGKDVTMTATVTGKQKHSLLGSDNAVTVCGHNGVTATVNLSDKEYSETDKGDRITIRGKAFKTPMAKFYGDFQVEK